MQIPKVPLDLIKEPPRAVAFRGQHAAAVLEAPRGAAGDGAQHVEVGQQGLWRRGLGADPRRRRVVGEPQHEQRVSQDQLPCRLDAGDVGVIEPTDLAGAEPMRHDRLDEPHAIGDIGARQGHEVLHRGVRDQSTVEHVLLDGLRERAHQTDAARHPAHTAIEAPRQRVEREAVILMQRAQQPALLEHTVGGIRAQELPKDQGLRLRHLPRHGGDEIAVQLTEAADAFVAVDDHVRRASHHDHDRHLLSGVRKRRQQPPLSRGLAHAKPLVAQIQLVKFQLHGGDHGRRGAGTHRGLSRSSACDRPQTMQRCGETSGNRTGATAASLPNRRGGTEP